MLRGFWAILFFWSAFASAQSEEMTPADSLLFEELYTRASQMVRTDIDSSLYYYQKLNTFLSEKEYHDKRFRVLLDMGNAYLTKGHNDRALEAYMTILEASEDQDNPIYDLYARISIAGTYLSSKDYKKALEQYEDIRQGHRVTDSTQANLRPFCAIFNNEGIANENLGRFEEAEQFYRKAIALSEKIDENYFLANAISNMGLLRARQGRRSEALTWHQRALALREQNAYTLGIVQSLTHLGENYLALEDTASAQQHYERALPYANDLGSSKQILEIAAPLKFIYESQGNMALAYDIQEMELRANKEILNEESVKTQERLKAEYEYELEKQIEEKNQKVRETIYQFSFGGVLLLFVLALILYLLQKSKTRQSELLNENITKEKHLLRQELEYKNKKLMTNLMFLLEKNELISDLTQKLKDTKKMTKAQSDKLIADTLMSLRQHLNTKSWEEFDLYFQEVHSDFYSKLTTKFQLTPNEMKLAAFTKLKLSSKEISSLTGQSVRTIDVGRYRLRKKLGITNSEVNLSTFLNSL